MWLWRYRGVYGVLLAGLLLWVGVQPAQALSVRERYWQEQSAQGYPVSGQAQKKALVKRKARQKKHANRQQRTRLQRAARRYANATLRSRQTLHAKTKRAVHHAIHNTRSRSHG